jgi:hypothetical protein
LAFFSFVVSLGFLAPSLASANPITYELRWTLDFVSAAPDDEVGAPLISTYTFDPVTSQFGTFVVEWPFPGFHVFDFGAVMNERLLPAERAFVAAALVTPDDNKWQALTRTHSGPDFAFGLDAPGLPPFTICLSDDCDGEFSSPGWLMTDGPAIQLGLSTPSFECFDFSFPCGAGGGYKVRRVPEPGTLMLLTIGVAFGGTLKRSNGRERRPVPGKAV